MQQFNRTKRDRDITLELGAPRHSLRDFNGYPLYPTEIQGTSAESVKHISTLPGTVQSCIYTPKMGFDPLDRSESDRSSLLHELHTMLQSVNSEELYEAIMFLNDKPIDHSLEVSGLASNDIRISPRPLVHTLDLPDNSPSSYSKSSAATSQAYFQSCMADTLNEASLWSTPGQAPSRKAERDSSVSTFSTASTSIDSTIESRHSTMSSTGSDLSKGTMIGSIARDSSLSRASTKTNPQRSIATIAAGQPSSKPPIFIPQPQPTIIITIAENQPSHKLPPSTPKIPFKAPPTPHHCTYGCGKIFHRKTEWMRHEDSIHNPQYLYTCGLNTINKPSLPCASTRCASKGHVMTSTHLQQQHCSQTCTKEGDMVLRFGHYRKDKLLKHVKTWHKVHMKAVPDHWISRVAKSEQYGCGFCGVYVGDWNARAAHVSEHFVAWQQMGREPDAWSEKLAEVGRRRRERASADKLSLVDDEMEERCLVIPEDVVMCSPPYRSVLGLLEDRRYCVPQD